MCVLIFCTAFVCNICHCKESWAREDRMCISVGLLHVQYRSLWADFSETWLFLTDFRQISKYQFHENPSGGSRRVAPCGRTDRQTDMTKLIDAFHNLAKAPNKRVEQLNSYTSGPLILLLMKLPFVCLFVITLRFLHSLDKHWHIPQQVHSDHACPITEPQNVQQSALRLHNYTTFLSPQQFRLIAQFSESPVLNMDSSTSWPVKCVNSSFGSVLQILQRMTFRHSTEVLHWCDRTRRQLGRLKSDITRKMFCWSRVPAWSFSCVGHKQPAFYSSCNSICWSVVAYLGTCVT
jgi:hypothetical protein